MLFRLYIKYSTTFFQFITMGYIFIASFSRHSIAASKILTRGYLVIKRISVECVSDITLFFIFIIKTFIRDNTIQVRTLFEGLKEKKKVIIKEKTSSTIEHANEKRGRGGRKRIIKRRDGFSVEAVLIEKSIRGEAERIPAKPACHRLPIFHVKLFIRCL